MSAEILVVPKDGKGHLFPCLELCNHLIARNYHITLILESDLTSSIPSSLLHSPLFTLTNISSSPSAPSPFPSHQTIQGLEAFLGQLHPDPTRPVFAVIDHIMSKTQEAFWNFGIPTVVFITSGAAWAAIQHAVWVVRPGDMKPGEARALPGLPENMVVSYSDLQQRRPWIPSPPPHKAPSHGHSGGPGGGMKPPRGPPLPGEPAPWVEEVKSSSAILINTCDDLERPFLDYVSDLTGKPVFGVGPLLPEQYWKSFESLLHDPEVRPKRESNYTEEEVIQWLDSKPRGSVVYVSFGSEVNPTDEEYPELAKALEESTRPFIWVIQRMSVKPGRGSGPPGPSGESYFPHGLDAKVGKRGLIIHGWAPQLLILSHPSAGGFISHCGWNSTLEAVVRGVPLLAWPIRGDQYYNAKMVVSYLKVGSMVSEGYPADKVSKEDIMLGLERVLQDEEIRKRSAAIRGKFENGYPASSLASLDAFSEFVNTKFVK